MTLDNSGNVGIGTTSPAGSLHVKGSTPVRILGDTSSLSGSEHVDFFAWISQFSSDLGGMRIERQADTHNIDTLFYAAAEGNPGTEKMRITGNGNVGIGTATPEGKLQVEGGGGIGVYGTTTGNTFAGAGVAGYTTGYAAGVWGYSKFGYGVLGQSISGYAGEFDGNVRVTDTLYYGTLMQQSDARLKRDVASLGYGLHEVLQLRPVSHKWKDKPEQDGNSV
jgi:endosialidase-like protein